MDELLGTPTQSMLVAATDRDEHRGPSAITKPRVLAMLARRSLPSVIEATVVPALLFYVVLVRVGPGAAMLTVLAWSYGAVLRRRLMGQNIPTILLLSVLGLTLRTMVGIMDGTFIYLLQPIFTTVVLAGVFLGSLLTSRPIIGRLAHDFCPLSPDIAQRPAVLRLFIQLTVLWAGVHLLTAATTFGLLVSLPTSTFVALKTVVSFGITVSAIVFTVSASIRIARAENLVFARVPE
jgi:hypothetical protein